MAATAGDAEDDLQRALALSRAEAGIEVGYTNVFWGGRSEIKPSEIAPSAYRDWCASVDLDPEEMV